MFRHLRRVGHYFGLLTLSEEELRARGALPPPSVAILVVSSLLSGSVGGLIFGALAGKVWSGIVFGVLMAVIFVAQGLWRRRRPDG